MRVSIFALALFACNSLAADYNTVVDGIQFIGNKTQQLDKSVKAVQPGLIGLNSILQASSDTVPLDEQIQQTAADANASPSFGTQGSTAVSKALANLEGTVKTTLSDLQSKRQALDDFRPVVLAALYQLKQDQAALGAALVKKYDAAQAGTAPAIIKRYEGYFNSAIVTFNGDTS